MSQVARISTRSNSYEYQWLNGHALYHPQAAKDAAEHIANGHSIRAAAGAVNLPYASIVRWIEEIPDFNRQIAIATTARVFELEKRVLTTKDGVQAKVFLQALRRAAPEAWDDPRTTPHGEDNALPTKVTIEIAAQPDAQAPPAATNKERFAQPPPPPDYKPTAPGSDTVQ